MSDLAVVVVNHNAGGFLRRSLDSIDEQKGGSDVDVVVVDNSSLDGSVQDADGRSGVRVIRNASNRGFAAAANQGIAATDAPFTFLLNPDAEIVGGTLEALHKVALERPRAGVIGALVRNSDGSLQPSARKVPTLTESIGHAFLSSMAPNNRFTRSYIMAGWDRKTEREVDWVSGSAMLIRREAFDEVGGFDEGYFMYVEDVDLCTRLRDRGWAVLFSPELEVVHESGVSSRTRSRRLAFEHSRSLYRYFRQHRADGPRKLLSPAVKTGLWVRAALAARRSKRA